MEIIRSSYQPTFSIYLFGNGFTTILCRGRLSLLFYVTLRNLKNLKICHKSLSYFLIAMGWKNILVIKEQYYENLVKVFYSNMIMGSLDRIVTSVGGIHIDFDD